MVKKHRAGGIDPDWLARQRQGPPPPLVLLYQCFPDFYERRSRVRPGGRGMGMEMRAAERRLHSRREESSPCCESGKEPLVNWSWEEEI